MSLSRQEIYNLVLQAKDLLIGAQLESIQEASPYLWIFGLNRQGYYHRLLVCLKAPLTRFYLVSLPIKNYVTPQTKSWASILTPSTLVAIEMAGYDRILKMDFQKGRSSYTVVFEVFPQRPNLYLLDVEQKVVLSFHPTELVHYALPRNLKVQEALKQDASITHKSIEEAYEQKEYEAACKLLKDKLYAELQQKNQKNKKQQQQALADLERCQKWNQVQHEGMLLQANMFRLKKGMTHVEVSDWEQDGKEISLDLDGRLSPQEQIASRFKRSKKLKSGLSHHQKFLDKVLAEAKKLEVYAEELAKAATLEALKRLNVLWGKIQVSKAKPIKDAVPLPYYEFKSASGYAIWVGKNAVSNDKLTFSYAKGSDWWLHVSNYPGSHVVIRIQKKQDPDEQTVQDALQLAMAYSKAKDKGEAEVCITQCKFVSRAGKNQPGKVQISRHKLLFVKYDPDRFHSIKTRGRGPGT
jgi:predicted ribosome quality control (RQC) complex YloA/Tae2 family protein